MKHLALASFFLCTATTPGFKAWTAFPDGKFKETRLWIESTTGAYCFITDHSRVDADGAPNAYNPEDLKRASPPYLGLDNPANAGWPGTSWWSSVLVPDPSKPAQPYVQPAGPWKGYFVAQTALRTKGGDPLSPSTYADSTTVPYIVLPGNSFPTLKGTGAAGDVGKAWNLENGKSTAFVIGDSGGGEDAKLGEGSIALFKALGGTNPNARNGSGVAPGNVRFVVFPGSRKSLGWPADNSAIAALADQLIGKLGGEPALSPCTK